MGLHINGPGRFAIEVAGESKYQAALDAACGGRTFEGVSFQILATLIPEDDNPADAEAVRVEIAGRPVGHLTAADAPSYRSALVRAGYPGAIMTCDAVIVGGWDRGDGDAGMFGVKLDLPPGPD